MYAVAVGKRGIYLKWKDVPKEKYVYKKFNTKEECNHFLDKIVVDPKGIIVFTDGGCTDNGKAWAEASIGVFIPPQKDVDEVHLSEKTGLKTNNEAELFAVKTAINLFPNQPITICTDSAFVIYTMWDIPNVYFKHVRAHTNNEDFYSKGNEEADRLASKALSVSNTKGGLASKLTIESSLPCIHVGLSYDDITRFG